MGISMASVSFRRTDNVNWLELKPKIMAMYQNVEGLTNNLEQEQNAYAIVSPYGDLGMILAEMPEVISRLTGDYAVFCECMDSDFALLELYHNGNSIDKCIIGKPLMAAEISAMMNVGAPDLAKWKPLLQNPKDGWRLRAALAARTLFVENKLRKISALVGLPIFEDDLVLV